LRSLPRRPLDFFGAAFGAGASSIPESSQRLFAAASFFSPDQSNESDESGSVSQRLFVCELVKELHVQL
jgi:hypothetical protein